jgi:hypothetical protein
MGGSRETPEARRTRGHTGDARAPRGAEEKHGGIGAGRKAISTRHKDPTLLIRILMQYKGPIFDLGH